MNQELQYFQYLKKKKKNYAYPEPKKPGFLVSIRKQDLNENI